MQTEVSLTPHLFGLPAVAEGGPCPLEPRLPREQGREGNSGSSSGLGGLFEEPGSEAQDSKGTALEMISVEVTMGP